MATERGWAVVMTAGDAGPDTSSPLLGDHVSWQLRHLCAAVGLHDVRALYAALMRELLGPAAAWPVGVTPAWRSEVSDDHTPVEYSISFDMGRTPRLRLLVEPSGRRPDLWANMQAGLQVLDLLADRYHFSLDRLSMLQDLFFPRRPQGSFGLWLAAELGRSGIPGLKLYLNPAVHGPDRAWEVVGEALARLGFGDGLPSLLGYGVPRDRQLDRFYIFSLDLGSPWGRPRAKVYVRHDGFSAAEAALAACAVPGVSPESIAQFCELVGGPGPFTGRPLISCFSFVEGDHERPSGYALHVPIRDYVEHDREARDRAAAALDRYGFDGEVLGRALAGLARRPLTAGVGLMSYVALVCNPRPRRMTVYVSSEAYEVAPPRSLLVLLGAAPPGSYRGMARKQAVVRDGQHAGVAPVTRMEPYRIKAVEPIPLMTRKEREVALAGAHYNLFDLRADQVTIDLLSDSGTGALSAAQLAAAMTGDESDAGGRSFHRFRAAVQELTSCEHILPVRQGRAAERILFTTLLEAGQITLSNTHFDTTRANVELAGDQARDLDSLAPFKGDIDLEALEHILDAPDRDRVALVIVTITNNGGGGQPMSMGNLAAVSRICQERRVPLFLDAARFAENAWLVTQRGPEFRDWSPREVTEAAFRLANGCVASMKKDGLVNMGGFLALSDEELARRCELLFIATDGFPTYEGLAGGDLDMLAQGLVEVTDPDYLRARADMARHLADLARAAGVAIVEPPGIHAIYLSAERVLPHLPPHWFPGHALACELYLEGGIRSAELGLLYVGEEDGDAEPLVAAPHQLVWLAIPRRVYTQTHIEYTGRVLARVAESAERIPGYHIVGSPAVLRHFRAKLEPVPIPPSRLVDRHLSCHPDEGARNPVRWGRPFCSVPTGTPRAVPRGASHHRSTPLHLAVSCYLVDRDGRLLIAQRAHVRATGASVRTNSCCGHPAPRDPCANPYAAMPAPRSVWMSRARP